MHTTSDTIIFETKQVLIITWKKMRVMIATELPWQVYIWGYMRDRYDGLNEVCL